LGLPLHGLIQAAYGVSRLRVEGGPAWVTSELFVIEATAASAARPDQTIERLRSLLADRFKLTMRRETRTMPVYELAVAPGGIRIAPMQPGECIPRGTPLHRIPLEGPFFMCGGGGRMTMLSQSPATRTIPRWARVARIEFGDIDIAGAIDRSPAKSSDRSSTGRISPRGLIYSSSSRQRATRPRLAHRSSLRSRSSWDCGSSKRRRRSRCS
jgi:hypothetical protein